MIKYIFGFLKYLFYKKISKLSLITSDSDISPKSKINRFSKIYSSSISDYSYLGVKSQVVNTTIGKYCSISGDCNIGLAAHSLRNISTSPIFTEKNNGTGFSWISEDYINPIVNRVEIGNDVWIGARVIIIGKVNILKIGDGAIIGAGSVVTKDVPPYSIVAGVPAKIIRYRFNPDIIEKLLELKWWNLKEEELKEKISFFQNDDLTLNLLDEF